MRNKSSFSAASTRWAGTPPPSFLCLSSLALGFNVKDEGDFFRFRVAGAIESDRCSATNNIASNEARTCARDRSQRSWPPPPGAVSSPHPFNDDGNKPLSAHLCSPPHVLRARKKIKDFRLFTPIIS
ncbi:hypothetical protein TNCV_4174101 [Trichonephila clavipes]|nr:hypothetical protein TNCV_4174101 [Trichonephila clavipes]